MFTLLDGMFRGGYMSYITMLQKTVFTCDNKYLERVSTLRYIVMIIRAADVYAIVVDTSKTAWFTSFVL